MTAIDIQFAMEDTDIPPREKLEEWAKPALDGMDEYSLTIRIVDENEITALNREWRGGNGPTNVLSFPYGDDQHVPDYLGDIVICAPVIGREADEQGKSLDAHWAHMLIHGILHLRGYDHQEKKETEEMEQREISLLGKIGFSNPYRIN